MVTGNFVEIYLFLSLLLNLQVLLVSMPDFCKTFFVPRILRTLTKRKWDITTIVRFHRLHFHSSFSRRFTHKNLVSIHGVCSEMDPLYIVVEYMPHGEKDCCEILIHDIFKILLHQFLLILIYNYKCTTVCI